MCTTYPISDLMVNGDNAYVFFLATHPTPQSNQAFAYISVILILFACFPSLLLLLDVFF